MKPTKKQRSRKSTKTKRSRRGVAIVLVLGVLSITLAMSYAMLRTRTQAELLQDNFSKQNDARLAAEAGMARALKAVSTTGWSGPDIALAGSLNAQTSYRATFAVGDSSLISTSPNYAEFPFRLTITSVGTAVNADNPQVQTKYTLRSVVQLAHEKVQDQSSTWTALLNFTLVQWNSGRTPTIEPLLQISGNAFLLGIPRVFEETFDSDNSLNQFSTDLKKMVQAAVGDHRPFTGLLYYPSSTPSDTKTTLSNLGTTSLTHTLYGTDDPVAYPGTITSYKLYPGGPSYSIPNLSSLYGSEVTGVTLKPDPQTNPLGIFRTTAAIRLGNNASIQGTILSPGTSNTVTVRGKNVVLSGYNLPAVQGSSTVRQLPAMLTNYNVYVEQGAQATVNGALMSWENLEVQAHTSETKLDINGRVFVNDIDVHGVSNWEHSSSWWVARLLEYVVQKLLTGPLNSPYYPVWLKLNQGQDPQPTLTISPDSSGVSYHWHDWTQPVYQVASGDSGLRWNLISWQVVP